jgi:hypothetical protein
MQAAAVEKDKQRQFEPPQNAHSGGWFVVGKRGVARSYSGGSGKPLE